MATATGGSPADSEITYATTRDGVQIAYQILGDGPIDIVWVNGMASNLDLNGESPPFARFQSREPRFARVLSFDKRGSGLSERSLGAGTLEERMDDIRAVMDDAGFDRAVIQAAADGGPIALAFVATYPERVTALVVQGSWARPSAAPDYECGIPPAIAEPFLEWVESAWGHGEVVAALAGMTPTPEQQEILGRIERSQGPPRVIADLFRLDLQMDARDALPLISVPTLVVSQTDHPLFAGGLADYLVDNIPDADFAALISGLVASGTTRNTTWLFLSATNVLFSEITGARMTCISRTARPAWERRCSREYLLDLRHRALRHQHLLMLQEIQRVGIGPPSPR